MTDHSIRWRRLDRPGHEASRLSLRNSQWHLEGTAVFDEGGQACRLDYQVVCDSTWRTMRARVGGWLGGEELAVDVSVDGAGRWWRNGVECREVAGCVDIDLSFSPSTNLLPIRRLALEVGEDAPVRAAWVRLPDLRVEPLEQWYRRIGDGKYGYESAGGRFRADLDVNDAGFVTRYPDLWAEET
jgi:hypothetical protein